MSALEQEMGVTCLPMLLITAGFVMIATKKQDIPCILFSNPWVLV
jgi:hypothetical protein